jgi:hypothetical protein
MERLGPRKKLFYNQGPYLLPVIRVIEDDLEEGII